MKKNLFIFLATFSVYQLNAQMSVTVNTTNVTCNAACDGTANASVTGGTAPYAYIWSNGPTTQSISGLCVGNYTVTVTDALGGQMSAAGQINQPLPLTISFGSQTNATCFGSSNGNSTAIVSGGTPPYSYYWPQANFFTPNANNIPPGNYNIIITDSHGCTANSATTITQPPQIITTITSVTPGTCNGANGGATVNATGGTGVITYAWIPMNVSGPALINAPSGNYSVIATDFNNCADTINVTITDSCDYVWPGDANDDAVANNLDILDIGIANSSTGTSRANASLNWIGQPSAAWGQTLISGTDYKFVDCNGDGIINPADTNAVIQNFGFAHNNREGGIPVYNASLPDLTVSMGQTMLASNTTGTLTISFGSSASPVSNFYGLAFTLNFDPNQIDASSFRMNENGTWMGIPGTDLMGVVLNNGNGTGAVQVALTRLNQTNTNGFGNIANMGFMTTGNLVGTGNTQNVNFTISNVTVIDNNEAPQSVNTINDSVIVADPNITGISSSENVQQLSAYPNPFTESVQLILPASSKGKNCQVLLTDATGRIVLTQNTNGAASITIGRGTLAPGIYFCSVRTNGQTTGNIKLIVNE